jgi:hypothetical protein
MTYLSVDMVAVSATATFTTLFNGAKVGEITFSIDSAALVGIIGASPVSEKSRGDDITDAVYEYAIAQGLINGVIA